MISPASMITAVAAYSPPDVVPNALVESMVNDENEWLCPGSIEKLFGVKERRFAARDVQVSDLATSAAKQLLSNIDPGTIDCLIFAAASSDLIEPATANIIQQKCGLTCNAFDVKNACNSFVSALNIANAFIAIKQYKKILLVTGEKLSDSIKYNISNRDELARRLAAFSLGDAGAAALVEPSQNDTGLYSQRFLTFGQYWNLCVIPGGGSMHPHDATQTYFEGKTTEMRNVFLQNKGRIAQECLEETGWQLSEIDLFFMHHVSKSTFEIVAASLGIPSEKFYNVMETHGNIASASIPFAMAHAIESGRLKKGDKIMLIGLASGISMSVQLLTW